jgi:NifU-like protein
MDQWQAGVSDYSSSASGGDRNRLETIAAVIEALRPGVQRDGGDLALVSVERDKIRVRLTGACTTCALASQTLGGVRRHLIQALGSPVRVIPAVD